MLSAEDSLRLNVLLRGQVQAIRINESSMTVFGLTDKGEAKVVLNPNCRDEQYLRRVREMISGHVLGSPGGFPIYLKRWTRMGQTRDQNLEQLLMLGEPEAVVATVNSPGLTNELARRAWWALPSSESARTMLAVKDVAEGSMGPELAEFLVEFLPFEEEPSAVMESVRLVLQPGLVSAETRAALWKRGRQKNAYLVGFMMAEPDSLPEPLPAREFTPAQRASLGAMAESANPYAALLLRLSSAPGQTYLDTAMRVLRKPSNQDVVNYLLDTLADYFSSARPDLNPQAELGEVVADACDLCAGKGAGGQVCPDSLRAISEALPELQRQLRALLIFCRLGYPVVRPIFSRTTAIGSLMRRKLEPVATPLMAEFAVLRGSD